VMAESKKDQSKSRIRKSVPTVRELSAKSSDETTPTKKRGRLANLPAKTVSKVSGSQSMAAKIIKWPLRIIYQLLRRITPKYFINSWRELKLVTWPGRKETWRLTGAVFVFAIVFGVAIYFVDLALERLFKITVLR